MQYFYILLIIWMIGYKYVSNALYFFSITSWICHPWGWCCPDQRQKEINHQALSQSAWAFFKNWCYLCFFHSLILNSCKMQLINILLVNTMKCHFESNSQPSWEIAWPMAMRFSWTFVLTFNGLIENRTCIYPATLCYIVMIKQLSLYQNCEIDGLAESGITKLLRAILTIPYQNGSQLLFKQQGVEGLSNFLII